jgi:hypothetical protein
MTSLSKGFQASALALSLIAGCNREVGVPSADANEIIITFSPEGPALSSYDANRPSVVTGFSNETGARLTNVFDENFATNFELAGDVDSGYIAEDLFEKCGEVSDQSLTLPELGVIVNICVKANEFSTARRFIDEYVTQNGSDEPTADEPSADEEGESQPRFSVEDLRNIVDNAEQIIE